MEMQISNKKVVVLGKAFCSPNYIFIGSEFMELKTMPMWLRGKALPW